MTEVEKVLVREPAGHQAVPGGNSPHAPAITIAGETSVDSPRHFGWWLVAVCASVVGQWRWLSLHDDVRASIGTLRAGEAGGLSPTDIFTHRPMVNRILMSGLDHLTFGPVGLRERVTLTLAVVLAGIAAACLTSSLRSWVGSTPANWAGLGVFAALAWAPDVTLLQPEWVAVLLCVPALALALAGGPARLPDWNCPRMGGAGLLLATAALQKYTTATSALLAWGIVMVLCRRRAGVLAGWTLLATAGLFGLTMLQPHEWLWVKEMPRLQPTSGVRWPAFEVSTWRVFWSSPVLLLWPAASIYGYAASRRRMWLFGPLLAALVTFAGVVVQERFYPYHYGALPVLISGLAALAGALWWQQSGRLSYVVVLMAGIWLPVAAWTGHHSYGWRNHHPQSAIAEVIGGAVLAGMLAAWQVRRAPATSRLRTGKLVLTVIGFALIVSFPDWPHTPAAYNWLDTTRASELTRRAAMTAAGEQIHDAASGAAVAYVTLQEGPYFVGLPATCSYPLAVFLYRSVGAHGGDLTGFREDLDCLGDPAAKFLVLQGYAAARGHALPVVRDTIEAHFDCRHPVAANSTYVLCPRR